MNLTVGHWIPPLIIVVAVLTACHALLYKRDTRSVIAWVAMVVLVPLAGAILYWLLAVNRVERRARKLRPRPAGRGVAKPKQMVAPLAGYAPLARAIDHISPFCLTDANAVEVLENGDAAYPRMLQAIADASASITLATYIFDGDETGIQFGEALAAAHRRGVQVRVLVDAHGRHNWQGDMVSWLADRDVRVAKFLPALISPTLAAFNLRNHRKHLVVDGVTAFTGGMNISSENVLESAPAHPVRDLHFGIRGAVATQVQQVFADDWAFATGERLDGPPWFSELAPREGKVLARAIPDGPDDHFDALKLVILAAIAQAQSRLAVMTPYFLPDEPLITALNTAALRGVEVQIVVPGKNDHRIVRWASQALYWQVLRRGCRIFHTPAPFDHSKLLLVDDGWALIGSTNWDPRSLRLNFELNLECQDNDLVSGLWHWFDGRRALAAEITSAQVARWSLPARLRNGAARLFTPYL